MTERAPVRLGLTLPTFVEDPEVLVAVARAAERSGVDGVFTFDHLYRIGSDAGGPSLALEPVLGALAVETERIALGSLVARAGVRHAATLAASFDSLERLAPGRVIAGVGSGDRLSDPEQEMFGLPTGGMALRVGALERTIETLHGRGYPVWVGGRSEPILATVAGLADGWNGWGLSPDAFAREVQRLRAACAAADRREGEVVPTWAGLVELREDRWDEARRRPDVLAGPFESMAATLRRIVDAGARWLVLAPVAPGREENAAIVSEVIRPLL